MTVVTGAGAAIVELLLTGFDAMARWVLDSGFDSKSVGERLAALGQLPGTGGGLVFLLAFLGMLASLVQVGIMLIRGAILSVLVGVLPVAAMGGSSGGGLLAGLATAGATGAVLLAGRGGGGGGSAAPAATTTPGLEQQSPSGANGTAGAAE